MTKWKETEIGRIPEEWEIVNLGNLAELIKGTSYRSEDYCSESEGRIFINLKCVGKGKFRQDGIKYYKGAIKQNQIANKGDVLIANTDLTQNKEVIGAPIRVPGFNREACFSMDLTKLVPNDKLDKEFMYYYLLSPFARNFMINSGNGTTVVHLSVSNVPNLAMPLPMLSEQHSIAKILSDLDSKIELNNQMNATLEAMAQAIFKHWFIDFEFPDENGKPYKSSGGKMVDSELGKIPERWKLGVLRDLAEVNSGKRPSDKSNIRTEEFSVELLGASSVMGYVKEALYTESIIVIGRVGTHGIVQRINRPSWPSDNTLVIRSRYYEYVFQCLKRIDYDSLNIGSTQPLITQTQIKNQEILIPEKRISAAFESLLSILYNEVEFNSDEITNLSSIRDSLLPKLMSGQIRVPVEVIKNA